MYYLNGTKELCLCLNSEKKGDIQWWVDSSYAVHPDYRSHTGIVMTMGKGSPINVSCKQKLNVKSSTEAELVGADDAMSYVMWTKYFPNEQGYEETTSIMYQDNQSAIILEKNGTKLSSKRTRHMNIRYFYITDCIKKGDLAIKYCPTGKMIADFLTKPLQGSKFINFRKANLIHD